MNLSLETLTKLQDEMRRPNYPAGDDRPGTRNSRHSLAIATMDLGVLSQALQEGKPQIAKRAALRLAARALAMHEFGDEEFLPTKEAAI